MIERRYVVPAEYRTKGDAKCAVACRAAEQGAIEFLRFRGGPIPPSYRTFHSELISGTLLPIHREVSAGNAKKRKHGVEDGCWVRKRKCFIYQADTAADTTSSDMGMGRNQEHDVRLPSAMATERGEPITWNSSESHSFLHANSVTSSSALSPVGCNFAGSSTSAYTDLS